MFGNSYFTMRTFTDLVKITFLSLLYVTVIGCSGACSLSPRETEADQA